MIIKNKIMDTSEIFKKGENAPPDYFTGAAWIKSLVPNETPFNCVIANVVFAPGSRNNWHTHPGGQVLICTHGAGYFQEKGKPIQLLHKGDVVQILPGIKHWHGASPGSEFTHIAVNTNSDKGLVNWMERVTDEEYNSFK
jgi:quercetin dioxygenase-like cupin family protein